MSKRIKIVIAEIIPSKNKGEEAILAGMIETFKSLGNTEIVLFSRTVNDDKIRYGRYPIKVVSYERNRYVFSNYFLIRRYGDIFSIMQFLFHGVMSLLKITPLERFDDECWNELYTCDVIIVGHDNVFSGGVGIRYLAILLFAKLLKKYIIVYESSIGPIKNKAIFNLSKIFLNKVDLITMRELISYNYVKDELGVVNDHLFLTADTAFLLIPANEKRISEILLREGIKNNRPLVGFTISRSAVEKTIAINGSHDDIYYRFILIFAEILDKVVNELKATVIIIPHVIGPATKQDDRIVASDIMRYVNNKDRVFNINNEYTAQELKGIIGKCDMLIGFRTHSLIAAADICVPAVALSDTMRHKTNGIIGIMLGQGDCLYNVDQFDSAKLWEKVLSTWTHRDQIRRDLESRINEVRSSARKNGVLLRNIITQTHF